MITIETNVPIPRQRINCKYPVDDLEVGQSFFVANGNRNSISVVASAAGKRMGRRFRTAKQLGGVRVWRVA
jgi:hypothetical protein